MKTAKEIFDEGEITVKDFEEAISKVDTVSYDKSWKHEAAQACFALVQKLRSPPANSSGNLAAGVDWDAIEKEFLDYGIHSNVGDQKKIEIVNWFKSQLTDSSTIKSTAHE